MFHIRQSKERGYADHGWLKSHHTFSFADYYDQNFMGYGPLRVINEDYIEGGKGFPTHGHRNMEIITYLISGALEHKDSTGSSGVIKPYEVQKMTAGKGIRHSEFNHLTNEQTHLLQIWIEPQTNELTPSYEQKDFKNNILSGKPTLLVSPNGKDGSIQIHQDTLLWAKVSQPNETWSKELNPKRKYWLQVVKGNLQLPQLRSESLKTNQPISLNAGDAIAITDEFSLDMTAAISSEVLLFDMK